MANITIIPPEKAQPDILRVAAYCRVSTDAKEQEQSYASQIRNYTELISRHDGWELVDIYADGCVIIALYQQTLGTQGVALI